MLDIIKLNGDKSLSIYMFILIYKYGHVIIIEHRNYFFKVIIKFFQCFTLSVSSWKPLNATKVHICVWAIICNSGISMRNLWKFMANHLRLLRNLIIASC